MSERRMQATSSIMGVFLLVRQMDPTGTGRRIVSASFGVGLVSWVDLPLVPQGRPLPQPEARRRI